jgi:hypothetical protein
MEFRARSGLSVFEADSDQPDNDTDLAIGREIKALAARLKYAQPQDARRPRSRRKSRRTR